jgi:hypothetical protein
MPRKERRVRDMGTREKSNTVLGKRKKSGMATGE